MGISFLFYVDIVHMQPWQNPTSLLRSLWGVSEAHFWLIQLRCSANRYKICYPLPLSLGIARKQCSGAKKKKKTVEYIPGCYLCYGCIWGRTELIHSHQLFMQTFSRIIALSPAIRPALLSTTCALSPIEECYISPRKGICLLNSAEIAEQFKSFFNSTPWAEVCSTGATLKSPGWF